MPNGISKPVRIRIPPGVIQGERVRYAGMAPDGNDLIANFKVSGHPDFSVDGDNLIKKLNINLKEAMLGTDKIINTLDNRSIKLHIKSGTQSGTKLRIPESGLPRKGKSNGDLLVDIRVKIPALVESDLEKTFAEVLNENTK
jgi:DnaJ-class molecular chaperone